MKNLISIIALLVPAYFVGQAAHAGVTMVPNNQETSLYINTEVGSQLQFSGAVKSITPSIYFEISELGSEVDSNSGKTVNVKLLQIRPVAKARPEVVTFVLGNGRYAKLKLIPTSGAERFYDLQMESKSKDGRDPRYMLAENALMKAMLKDQLGGFSREIVTSKVTTKVEDLKFDLQRIYSGPGLAGFVYKVKNTSRSKVEISLPSINVGVANRAAMAQVDKFELEPCPLLRTSPECTTVLRMVVRQNNSEPPRVVVSDSTAPSKPNTSKKSDVGGVQ